MTSETHWRAVIVAYLAGVIGAVQVGRVAPAIESIRADLDLSLSLLGWAVSLITLASALAGLLAGFALQGFGAKRVLIAGCLVLAGAAALSALAPGVGILLGLRGIEGIGYLCIVVAAPTLIAQNSAPRDIPRALALWATFFTTGLSVAAFAGGWASNVAGWRAWYGGNAALMLGLVPLMIAAIPRDAPDPSVAPSPAAQNPGARVLPGAVWFLGFGFLGVALSALAILSMLPPFLIDMRAMAPGASGSVTGIVALGSIVGSLLYGVFGTRARNRARVIGIAMIVTVFTMFPAFSIGVGTATGIVCAAIAVAGTGVLVAHVFASIPRLAITPSRIGPANGLVAQIGSLGALLGPPVVGGLVSGFGWTALAVLVTVSLVAFWVLNDRAETLAARR